MTEDRTSRRREAILIGLGGDIAGTSAGIRNTRGPRERAFMVRTSLWCWLAGGLFLAGLLLLPKAWARLMRSPYAVARPRDIRCVTRRRAALRSEDAWAARGAPL